MPCFNDAVGIWYMLCFRFYRPIEDLILPQASLTWQQWISEAVIELERGYGTLSEVNSPGLLAHYPPFMLDRCVAIIGQVCLLRFGKHSQIFEVIEATSRQISFLFSSARLYRRLSPSSYFS
jgi:hypothetical protein